MHVHVEEESEKKRLREATAIIAVGGVTNGVLGTAKIVLGTFTGYLPLTAGLRPFFLSHQRGNSRFSDCQGNTFPRNSAQGQRGALYVELTAETEPDMTITQGYAVIKQIRERIMDQVPNVIDVTTLLTPKGEFLRQFLGSET